MCGSAAHFLLVRNPFCSWIVPSATLFPLFILAAMASATTTSKAAAAADRTPGEIHRKYWQRSPLVSLIDEKLYFGRIGVIYQPYEHRDGPEVYAQRKGKEETRFYDCFPASGQIVSVGRMVARLPLYDEHASLALFNTVTRVCA